LYVAISTELDNSHYDVLLPVEEEEEKKRNKAFLFVSFQGIYSSDFNGLHASYRYFINKVTSQSLSLTTPR
jgi:hypothetical protein